MRYEGQSDPVADGATCSVLRPSFFLLVQTADEVLMSLTRTLGVSVSKLPEVR